MTWIAYKKRLIASCILWSTFIATAYASDSKAEPPAQLGAAVLHNDFGEGASFWMHSAAEDEGQSVIDEVLFDSIRARYNGSWPVSVDASAKAETLRDGSLLVEVDGRLAELFFYELTNAQEDILYIPSVRNERYSASWLNYFNRGSDAIICGLSSEDLKRVPFPDFKCRMRIDAEGTLHAFLDRTADTSRATPPTYDGKWENEQQDFHWRSLSELQSAATAYSANQGDAAGFDFEIFGEIASFLYRTLNVAEQNEHWGSLPVKIKIGRQIWCANIEEVAEISSNDANKIICRVSIEPNGRAFQDYESDE